MNFSRHSSIVQSGIKAASYGGYSEYAEILRDPLSKSLAEAKLRTKGTSNLLKKLQQRDEPPQAFYEMEDFAEFEGFVEMKKDFSKHKKDAEKIGLQVLRTEGYSKWFDNKLSEQVKEDLTFYCLRNPITNYEIHFVFDNNDINFMGLGSTMVIHIMLVYAPVEYQGNFFAMRKLLRDFKQIFLNDAGIPYGYGRSHPDNQWNVKKKPNGEKNWRKKVKQIKNYKTGKMTTNAGDKLTAMYLRCGFVYPAFDNEEYPTIFYLSDKYKNKILADPENSGWLESRLQYSKYEK